MTAEEGHVSNDAPLYSTATSESLGLLAMPTTPPFIQAPTAGVCHSKGSTGPSPCIHNSGMHALQLCYYAQCTTSTIIHTLTKDVQNPSQNTPISHPTKGCTGCARFRLISRSCTSDVYICPFCEAERDVSARRVDLSPEYLSRTCAMKRKGRGPRGTAGPWKGRAGARP